MRSKSSKNSKIIREMKKHAKEIIDKKHRNDILDAFKILDSDGTGEIDTEELREVMKNISTDITE